MNGKYLERFGKRWGTNAKHATAWRWRQVSSYNYKLYEDSVKLAKRSQKLLCSLAVDLRHLSGAAQAPLDAPAAGSPAHAQRRQVTPKPAPVDERPASTRCSTPRTATSMPKTALPPFLVETVDIAAADPGLFDAFGQLDRGGVLLGDTDATNVQMAGHHFSQVHLRDFLSALRPARAVPAHRRTPGRWRRNRLAHSSMSNRRRPRSDAPSRRRKRRSRPPWHAPSGSINKEIELGVRGRWPPLSECTICDDRLARGPSQTEFREATQVGKNGRAATGDRWGARTAPRSAASARFEADRRRRRCHRGGDDRRGRPGISVLDRLAPCILRRLFRHDGSHLRRQRDLRRLPPGAKRSFGTARSTSLPCNMPTTNRCSAISPMRPSTITACDPASSARMGSFSSRPTGPTAS